MCTYCGYLCRIQRVFSIIISSSFGSPLEARLSGVSTSTCVGRSPGAAAQIHGDFMVSCRDFMVICRDLFG